MSITVKIDLGYEFDVKAKAAEVFEVLSNVPTSISHFPKVGEFEKLVEKYIDNLIARFGGEV